MTHSFLTELIKTAKKVSWANISSNNKTKNKRKKKES